MLSVKRAKGFTKWEAEYEISCRTSPPTREKLIPISEEWRLRKKRGLVRYVDKYNSKTGESTLNWERWEDSEEGLKVRLLQMQTLWPQESCNQAKDIKRECIENLAFYDPDCLIKAPPFWPEPLANKYTKRNIIRR